MTSQRATVRILATGTVPVLILALGCSDRKTVASKSAAAYDEARQRGVPVGGGHGHDPSPEGGPTSGGPHATHDASATDTKRERRSAHEGAGRSGHSGAAPRKRADMDHSRMGHTGAAAADHSAAGHAGTAAVDHSKMDHSQPTGMDHSRRAEHGGGMALPLPKPEPVAATAAPGEPAATLRPDPIDAPAATAITDSARSAAMAAEMASGAHAMQHGSYVQTDAGRDDGAPTRPPASGHGAHPGSTTPDPHLMHEPSPRPSPTPRTEENRP
jgi:hypothetical protein